MTHSNTPNRLALGSRRQKLLAAGLATLTLGGAIVAGDLLAPRASLANAEAATSSAHSIAGLPESFSDLVKQVSPAVVNISVKQAAGTEMMSGDVPQVPPGMEGSPFEDFFKRHFEDRPEGKNRRQARGVGSGFIIDPEGYIVTNHHVTGTASEITVTLDDGTTLPATLLGHDAKTDLALLKVEPKEPLPYVGFGDSEVAEVGDWVVAVGNPFGLGGTVTAGIVSARGRDIGAGPFDDFIQIDAPINRGNSGGPLFNTTGEVIGINSAIFSPNGGSVGIGFAIPASLAKPVLDQLRETGSVERGWLGVQIQHVTDDLAEGLGLEESKGALIASVTAEGPAANSGLRQGDVILSFNGEAVEEMRDLPRLVAETPAESDAQIEVWRDGEVETLTATIGKMPGEEQQAAVEQPSESTDTVLGLDLASMSDSLRERLGLAEDAAGVVVMDVAPDSKAAEQGFRSGDVILKVNTDEVATPAEFAEAVAKAEEDERNAIVVLMSRGDNERFVALPLADA